MSQQVELKIFPLDRLGCFLHDMILLLWIRPFTIERRREVGGSTHRILRRSSKRRATVLSHIDGCYSRADVSSPRRPQGLNVTLN